jgi:hypothetical protein
MCNAARRRWWGGGRRCGAALPRRAFRPEVEALDERLVPSFTPVGPFPVGPDPTSVAVGDFNGDGKLDLAIANSPGTTVSIRLGDGRGGFVVKPDVLVGNRPESVAVGDFNGDGLLDFATANNTDNTLSIRLGNGIGGFTNAPNVAVSQFAGSPVSVAVGDFNGDGILDLAAGPCDVQNNTVSIRLGTGTGGFTAKPDVAFDASPFNVAVADFNGDGHLDLAAANPFKNTVGIRLGDGAGSFTGSLDVAVGNGPSFLALGDFNGDGKLDFGVTNSDGTTVSIRLGNGAGSFTSKPDVAVGMNPAPVAVADFNGDGKLDFAVANIGSNLVSIRLGDGAGGFAAEPNATVGSLPLALAAGDFNGDGKPDFVVANWKDNTFTLLLNTFPGPVPPVPPPSPVPPAPRPPEFVASVLRKKGKFVVQVTDAATGAVRLRRTFPFKVQVLRQDVSGDGLLDVVLLFRQNGKKRRLLFSGRDLSPLPSNPA